MHNGLLQSGETSRLCFESTPAPLDVVGDLESVESSRVNLYRD